MPNDFTKSGAKIPGVAKSNIESIMLLEQEHRQQRSRTDRLGEAVSRLAGSVGFLAANICVFLAWILVNIGLVPGLKPVDPYPFSFLALLVSIEAIILSAFVLMNQSRQTRQEDHWAHLNLQIGMLAEHETTKVLQLLRTISDHLGLDQVARDRELSEMVNKTAVGPLAQELAENLEKTRDAAESDNGRLPDSQTNLKG